MNLRSTITTRHAALAFLAAITTALAGCFMPLDTPGIDLNTESAYNDENILISYSLWSTGTSAQARWMLRRFDPVTPVWVDIDSREVRLPNGGSGVLQLGFLDEAKYELTFELLTTRDGSYDPVPYLTQRREFTVDRTAPVTPPPTTILYYENEASVGMPAFNTKAEAEFVSPPYDPDRESSTVVLARIDEALPLLWENARPERFVIWDSSYPGPGITLYYVAIDEAGNRGNLEVVTVP